MNNKDFEREVILLSPYVNERKINRRTRELIETHEVPIVYVWNEVVVCNRADYKICINNGLFYMSEDISADSEEEALLWICKKLLEKPKELNDALRKYAIGKYVNILSAGAVRSKPGSNFRYAKNAENKISYRQLSKGIGEELFISDGTVRKYETYYLSIKKIDKVSSMLVDFIMMNKIKISHQNLDKLSTSSEATIKKVAKKLIDDAVQRERQCKVRKTGMDDISQLDVEPEMKIKITPEFNPDVEIKSLTFTVPSWTASIARVEQSNLSLPSEEAKAALVKALLSLVKAANSTINKLRGETDG